MRRPPRSTLVPYATLFRSLKGHTSAVSCVAISPDGKRLVSGSWDSTLKVWDADKGTEALALKSHTSAAACVSLRPDGNRLLSASKDNTLQGWAPATATEAP